MIYRREREIAGRKTEKKTQAEKRNRVLLSKSDPSTIIHSNQSAAAVQAVPQPLSKFQCITHEIGAILKMITYKLHTELPVY